MRQLALTVVCVLGVILLMTGIITYKGPSGMNAGPTILRCIAIK